MGDTSNSETGCQQVKKWLNRTCAALTTLFMLANYIFIIFAVHYYFRIWSTRPIKSFKWLCIDEIPDDAICFISIGQFAVGIISIGQICFGMITISQVGLSLIFGFGQAHLSIGYAAAQVAIASYVIVAQLGIASVRAKFVLLGLHLLPFFRRRGSLYVCCCSDSCQVKKEEQRQVPDQTNTPTKL